MAEQHVEQRPADVVERVFSAVAPNRLWLADLTYVSTWSGSHRGTGAAANVRADSASWIEDPWLLHLDQVVLATPTTRFAGRWPPIQRLPRSGSA